MQFLGTIVSYDAANTAGLIALEGSMDSVVFLGNDVQFKWRGSLVGRKVTFEAVNTRDGPLAVNIRSFQEPRPSINGIFIAPVAIAAVAGLTAAGIHLAHAELLFSYFVAVNAVVAMFILFGGNLPRGSKVADFSLWIMVFGGGALALLLTFSMYFGQFRKDAVRLFVAVLAIGHILLIRELRPELFTRTTLKKLFTLTTGTVPPESDEARRDRGFGLDPIRR